ncbi:MAG: DUF4358 domain-containing protein [Christensenellales bacterium]
MKMKKALVILAFIMLLTAACAKEEPARDVSVLQLAAAVNTGDQFDMLFETEQEYVEDMTGLDMSLLEEYYFGDPSIDHATTLYIVKVKDDQDISRIHAALEKRLNIIQNSFEQGKPDQYELAQQGVIVENGRYVMLVIAKDMEKALNDFEDAIGR